MVLYFSSTSTNRFYFCELENGLICRVSYKSFISFLENLERQFQWLKIVWTKNKYYYSNVWYFNTMNWIEQKHLLEVLNLQENTCLGNPNWKPFKNDKKCFLFPPQKLFSFSRYLSFCLHFLVMYRNGLIKKIRLISNFMTSQPD